uniref:SFRICE_036159 n=1 Tax=Spodoptera frugiperda TaxID=7108 RepID=A0A2H1W548_SPOFR
MLIHYVDSALHGKRRGYIVARHDILHNLISLGDKIEVIMDMSRENYGWKDPCVRRVVFRGRLKEPSDHHRWGPLELISRAADCLAGYQGLDSKHKSNGTDGKQVDGSPDGKELPPSMDTRNTRGVISALPTFWGFGIGGSLGNLRGNQGLGRLRRRGIGPPDPQDATLTNLVSEVGFEPTPTPQNVILTEPAPSCMRSGPLKPPSHHNTHN